MNEPTLLEQVVGNYKSIQEEKTALEEAQVVEEVKEIKKIITGDKFNPDRFYYRPDTQAGEVIRRLNKELTVELFKLKPGRVSEIKVNMSVWNELMRGEPTSMSHGECWRDQRD